MWQPKDFKIITKTTCYHSRSVGQDRMLSPVKTNQWVNEGAGFWSMPFLQHLTHLLNLCLIKRFWYALFQMLIISNGRIGQKHLIVSFDNSINLFWSNRTVSILLYCLIAGDNLILWGRVIAAGRKLVKVGEAFLIDLASLFLRWDFKRVSWRSVPVPSSCKHRNLVLIAHPSNLPSKMQRAKQSQCFNSTKSQSSSKLSK